MRARKISGIRLKNYWDEGINWKDHKDVILDFWKSGKCRADGYVPKQFERMFTVRELPTKAQEAYHKWFDSFDFQTDKDPDWIKFVNGSLNFFYHTSDPQVEPDGIWYIDMMQSEVEARDIATTQIYHGNPHLEAFWRIDTNSKPEEVGGRRNGYMYTSKLADVSPKDTVGYYWAIAFQCKDTASLAYDDNGTVKRKCINWAADARHMTLLMITSDGRFKIVPVFVEGKSWRSDRHIPEGNVIQAPMTAQALDKYFTDHYHSLFGIWDDIDIKVKRVREDTNQRKNALATFNDEEIRVGGLVGNIDTFINDGRVSYQERERNREVRKALKVRNQARERAIKAKLRDLAKNEKRKDERKMDSLNAGASSD